MRYLLVAADKSSQLPVEIPNEIVVHTKASKHKSTASKSAQKVKKRPTKAKNKVSKKRKQISRPIAK